MTDEKQLELALLDIWQDVLGLTHIDINASFLDIGGNSIAAERIANRANKLLGIEIHGVDILEYESIGRLVEVIEKLGLGPG